MRLSGRIFLAAFAGMLSVPSAMAQIDLPSMHADPSKYMLYRCPQLAQARPALVTRMHELEGLMTKAAAGTGGSMIGTLAYRSDYLAVRGDLNNLERRAAELNCPPAPALPAGTSAKQHKRP